MKKAKIKNIHKIENKKFKRLFNEKSSLLNNNSSKKKLIVNKWKYFLQIFIGLFSLFTVIALLLYISMLNKRLNELEYINKIYKIFNTNQDLKLFLKNKTEYYYKKRKHFFHRGYNNNESNLITFQDKLNYLVIHESPEYKSNLADKIKLSEYSKKKLGKNICVPILKIYDDANEINLNELPDKFILKCNHGSGMNIICKDKSKFDFEMAKRQLNIWKSSNYGFETNEFQYIFIDRKIFASPYLGDDIIDYKIFCFNGNPKYIAARKYDETEKLYFYNYYDFNWTLTDIEDNRNHYRTNPNFKFAKPKNLNLMYEYAAKLSEEFVFVRVDLYEINNKVYLGELTFAPSNVCMSFKDEAQRIFLGKLLDIRKIKPSLFNN